ncbi:hypothetical protein [Salinibacter ruber]|uniref:hypothetical protein n=1 Tax=Salinibacter ruber TaxID=146919 RepID=UPI001ABA6CB8|nr:hypothetical protein [Salinibacter ruber]MCS3752009.1 hypothetical protein [Salinibacter ruber]MCS3757289.1 hypothetical protein [Salinibacter ruber]MCS3955543.1 hypothetical protein [Salinibacter ruber]MCS4113929.1 hypothetical protein [Salinibacter ruber]
MTQAQQWLVGQLGVLVAFIGFVAQALVQKGMAAFHLPWRQAGAEGWAVWGLTGAAIGTAVTLGQFFRGAVDLSCHRMPEGVGCWVYPAFAVVGPLAGLANLMLLALEMGL